MGSDLVVSGASLQCTQGSAPAALAVLPASGVSAGGAPVAVIADMVPTTNIPPFGMCRSLSNPAVSAATSAAQGTLTPQPCVPVTTAPWSRGVTTLLVGGKPTLNKDCTATCSWAGTISVKNAGQSGTTG